MPSVEKYVDRLYTRSLIFSPFWEEVRQPERERRNKSRRGYEKVNDFCDLYIITVGCETRSALNSFSHTHWLSLSLPQAVRILPTFASIRFAPLPRGAVAHPLRRLRKMPRSVAKKPPIRRPGVSPLAGCANSAFSPNRAELLSFTKWEEGRRARARERRRHVRRGRLFRSRGGGGVVVPTRSYFANEKAKE